mmetsp:Transcript_43807/g.39025  ORF Transcript_43807/g.39025 Transcript_43807/m.39025 type:complete len:954 (-) Transcript_43807:179-3040(-)
MTSRWQPMNTMNSMSNTQNSFSSKLRYSNPSQTRSSFSQRQQSNNNNYSSHFNQNKNRHNQFSINSQTQNINNQTIPENRSNGGFNLNPNVNNINHFNVNNMNSSRSSQSQNINNNNNNNYLTQIFLLLQSNIIRLFASYPIWIQGIITAIIGFIAYFFFDFAESQQSVQSFILYKILSFVGFLTSVSCVYLLYQNILQNTNKRRQLRATIPSSLNPTGNNPYNTTSTISSSSSRQDQDDFNIGPKRDELYFTKKAMNRVSSSTYNVDTKYDYSSSPTKIASYDPNQIVTQQGLNKFLDKQSKQNNNNSSLPNIASMATPMASAVINNNIKTPIGKAFGSMRMTPAIKQMPPLFDTPNNKGINANNGSANIYTPGSSNMDVTMISYDNNLNGNDKDDPFKNLEYSAIHPTPINGKPNQQSVAWNVSGFGGGQQGGLGDISTIAQPGTPARISGGGGYNYSSMYSDINLRGDNIGQVTQKTTNNTLNTNNNLLNTLQQQQLNAKKKVNITRAPPISPFSRMREQEKKKASLLSKRSSHDRMNPVVFTTMGIKKSHFAAYYLEQSINLYSDLNIDSLIVNWAESMRWWLAEMVKSRCQQLFTNDNDINKIFNLLVQKYGLQQQLSQFKTASQRESFVIQNKQQLLNVAKQENNPKIPHIIQKRQVLKGHIDFVTSNYRAFNNDKKVTEYVYNRIKQLSSTNNLTLFNWNRGGNDNQTQWQSMYYPTDAHLIMSLFCRYMDDAMCPAVKFSEKHYFQISRNEIKKIHTLYKKFKDIAIICVYDINTKEDNDDLTAKDSLPYYFIAYNKDKFGKIIKSMSGANNKQNKSTLIRKPQHFITSTWNTINDSFNNYIGTTNGNKEDDMKNDLSGDEDNYEDNYYHDPVRGDRNRRNNRRNKSKSGQHLDSVGTWFPQPGKNNLLHTITLFAVFLHRCCDDKLTGIALKDQGCTLLQPILR